MPVTLRFQSTGSIPGNTGPVQMQGPSLTIGRGPENELVLPDPDRLLSKRHCAIEDHNGNVVVVDFSTNGTFLNYGKLALGATPTPLNDGDILSVGPYEILVNITTVGTDDILADPLEDAPISPGFAANAPSAMDLLDAPGDGGDFLDDLLGGRDAPVGPRGVDRNEPDEDGLLPPLGDDDPLLPPAADPFEGQGASTAAHNPSMQDAFAPPQTSGGAIPDDWDDDLLAPSAPAASAPVGTSQDPFAAPIEPSAASPSKSIPDDFGLQEPPAVAEPEPELPVEEEPAAEADMAEEDPAPIQEVTILPGTPVVSEPAPHEAEPVAATESSAAGGDAAARAFLKSLGAEDVAISDEELLATMSRMGHVTRMMIEGMREVLMTRTSIKSEFRIEHTMIQAEGNNPLKFSISPDQAIEAMVKPKAKGYLDAADATQQALDDIKAHEIAVITGMESALKGILAKLDPAVLAEKIVTGGGLGSVLKSKKARYWEIYETMYAEISDQAENDFHELFAKEFAKAYQEQLDKLK